jgi:hypothetical protein
MKMQIVGFEGSSGTSKTSGNAYEIGQLHALARLASAFGSGNVAAGFMGTTYRCPLSVIKTIAHLAPPFMAEVDVQDVMKFGKREQEVVSVLPIEKQIKG